MINEGTAEQQLGPWEVTVMPANGASVLHPNGDTPAGASSNVPIELQNDIAWYRYQSEKAKDWHKGYYNANEGWLALIDQHRNVFIKSFPVIDASELAPKQGNIEVYVSGKQEYIEIENHGKFVSLKPGEYFDYEVKWMIRKLPENISDSYLSEEVVSFVRSQLR